MVVGENFDDSVQVVARPDSAECLEFVAYFDQEINRVQWPTFLQQLTVGSFFNQELGGAVRPSTLQFIIVGNDFEHPIDGIISSTGARVQVVLPCVLEYFKVLLVGVFLGSINRVSCLHNSSQ